MDACISNGLSSDYVVLTNKNKICSGVFCLFPASDRLALDAMKFYLDQLPDKDKDKETLRHWINKLSIEWAKADQSQRWEDIC